MMTSFPDAMHEYKKQMTKGVIVQAYRGLMDFMMQLRLHFQQTYPDFAVSGSLYYGHMDTTYFAFTPPSLKRRKLKIAILFQHDTCGFEVWLCGNNKQIQTNCWKQVKESSWDEYRIPATTQGVSIVEHNLVDNPDFGDLKALTEHIEKGALAFIKDVEDFLAKHE